MPRPVVRSASDSVGDAAVSQFWDERTRFRVAAARGGRICVFQRNGRADVFAVGAAGVAVNRVLIG